MTCRLACYLACSLACNMTNRLAYGMPVIQVGQDCEECRTSRTELRSYRNSALLRLKCICVKNLLEPTSPSFHEIKPLEQIGDNRITAYGSHFHPIKLLDKIAAWHAAGRGYFHTVVKYVDMDFAAYLAIIAKHQLLVVGRRLAYVVTQLQSLTSILSYIIPQSPPCRH